MEIIRSLPNKVIIKEFQRRGFIVWKPIQEDTAQELIRLSENLRQCIKNIQNDVR